MDPKGKGIVINDKEKESFVNEPKDDKPTDSGSGHKRKDGKKKKTRRIKNCLPGMLSTAPSCLGAIKGTPRHMEKNTKHSLSIPKHQDSNSAHLIFCDSN